MTQIFGEFREGLLKSQKYLTLGFLPHSISKEQRWRTNGLVADILADYVATFFPQEVRGFSDLKKQKKAKGSIAYIANELLQNAMQYNDETFDDVSIHLLLHSNHLLLSVTNSIPVNQIEKFQAFIQKLLDTDLEKLYVQQMTRDNEETTSGLGLLMLIQDYGVKLGWKFDNVQKNLDVMIVTTIAQLTIQ